MKKKLFILCVALVWTASLMAQNISVVTPSGTTKLYRTLDEAIAFVNENADCVVYLPGGGHTVSSSSKITKKVTIIGIGHKIKGENADGYTTVSGELYFNGGSDGSALLGCHVTGTVHIGNDNTAVNDVLVRYCNVQSIEVNGSGSKETVVNQCYVRGGTYFLGNNGYFTHNISGSITGLFNGFIEYNVITGNLGSSSNYIRSSSITGNIFTANNSRYYSDCQIIDNAVTNGSWGEGFTSFGTNNTDVFLKPGGPNSTSDYHFTESYSQYQNTYGPYVGNQFNDTGLPPVPYIVAKQIPTETDASGMLNIKIRVKASE